MFDKKEDTLTNTEINCDVSQIKQEKLFAKIRHRKGLILYELNLKTLQFGICKPDLIINEDGSKSRKVKMKEGFIYREALNKANANKKFSKIIESLVKP
jgi:hypothetical protein